MASQEREKGPDLSRLDALEGSPQTHHLFQALRLIEAAYDTNPRLGRSRRPAQDPVRLGQEPELAFPTSTIARFAINKGRGTRSAVSACVWALWPERRPAASSD